MKLTLSFLIELFEIQMDNKYSYMPGRFKFGKMRRNLKRTVWR